MERACASVCQEFIDNILEQQASKRGRHLIRRMGAVWKQEVGVGGGGGYDMTAAASGDNLWHTKNIALRHSNVPLAPGGGDDVGVLLLLLFC